MRLLIQHRSHYVYGNPAALGPHLIRLRPASHCRAQIEAYSLTVKAGSVTPRTLWQQDVAGNHVARVTFPAGSKVESFSVIVELAVAAKPVNPFDFFIDDRCRQAPFTYPADIGTEITAFQRFVPPVRGSRIQKFFDDLPRAGTTVDLVVELNRLVAKEVRYVIRNEPGVWTPEETLNNGRGSCRDSAALLVALLRSRGFAARFVSGYLVQLTDEGMIPDQPRGVGHDVVDLHAWTEVFIPGAGWLGLDSTSGLLCGEGHIPLAATAEPSSAAPIEGTSSEVATDVQFELVVGRVGHEPRPTAPYTDDVWRSLEAAGEAADRKLAATGIVMTMGGEPTFTSRENSEADEWNSAALGPSKLSHGRKLAAELRRRLAPGAMVIERMGKHYPGESLPRWSLELIGRKDGVPVWPRDISWQRGGTAPFEAADRLMRALSSRLTLQDFVHPAFEDPWHFLAEEAKLPLGVDPLRANLEDSEERRRLARVLGRGLRTPAGWVLPLTRRGGQWTSFPWRFRRDHLFLLPGDSPIGLRLPLESLPPGEVPPGWIEARGYERDPRLPKEAATGQLKLSGAATVSRPAVRTALCVEARDGDVRIFLPPLWTQDDCWELLAQIDAAARDANVEPILEGYPPPKDNGQIRFSVTPDPGVLEVNLPPVATTPEHTALIETVFAAALHAGLHSERYQLDGRQAGSGGGHHLTLGGPNPLESPFLQRPDLLASWLTFTQHHPSLSYLFTGLFVGPTSQAPRVDEARPDTALELEIALRRAFEQRRQGLPQPWQTDLLFRHLLTDLTGNTHRAEVCIDKLFDPQTPHGRQGLVELRAFEMPPHPRMAAAQMILVRSLAAALSAEPYDRPLARWGTTLHDRFLLPYWMWRDFEDVLGHLARQGLPLDAEAFRPFLELRCPLAGTIQAGDVRVEVRNAIEPWHVLGEELTSSGTARYVDSSVERIELRAESLVPERHVVLVNGRALPMRTTANAGEAVGGVRFRAWAPPHALHAHLGIHHPIRIDVLDTWARRSMGGGSYHVWHPEGRSFQAPPLTRFEAAARRAQRFTIDGPQPWPVDKLPLGAHPDMPYTTDLRRFAMDHAMPDPEEELD